MSARDDVRGAALGARTLGRLSRFMVAQLETAVDDDAARGAPARIAPVAPSPARVAETVAARPRDDVLRVLFVEDDMAYAGLVAAMLRDGTAAAEIVHVERVAAARDALARAPFDCVVMDLTLPDARRLDGVRTLHAAAPDVAKVVLTGVEDHQLSFESIGAGAQDYLHKDALDRDVLVRSIRYAIERKRAEIALRERDELNRAVLDSLPTETGVVDAHGNVIAVNRAWRTADERLGRAAVVGQHYAAVCRGRMADPDDAARAIAAIDAVVHGDDERGDLDYRAADDDDVWFNLAVVPLVTRRGGAVVSHADVSERKRAEAELSRRALHDPLTGLANRALLLDRLGTAIAALERRPGKIALFFLDLDGFKSVNDELGHEVGDRVLVTTGERLRDALRPTDVVARFGGDEFAVLCEGIEDDADVLRIARRVQERLDLPFELPSGDAALRASIGIAVTESPSERAEALVRDADAAMYQAKKSGGGRHWIATEPTRTRLRQRRELQLALSVAVDNDELRMWYQPIVETGSGDIVGVEALLRWQHPERGLLAPREFLPLAEDGDLILPIGEWVLDTTVAQAAAWWGTGARPPAHGLFVNVAAQQLVAPGFAAAAERVMRDAGVPASTMCFEVTESAFLGDLDAAVEAAIALKALGARLAIDDFGTGYCSLDYLKRLPVDVLKIDAEFVGGLGRRDTEDSAIVAAIVELARMLSLPVVAEGVETSDQLAELHRLPCELAQGFWFSTPRPPDDFVATDGRLAIDESLP